MEYKTLVSESLYICYKYNRQRSPDITPEKWKCVFGNIEIMEERFQEENNND